jgi:GNAT superfamily N-acetyltransferase
MITLNLNGYTDLPAGKIATIVTYLEMHARPRLRRLSRPAGLAIDRIGDDLARYRALFRAVGEDWLWFSRRVMPDQTLRSIIGHPQVEACALVSDGRDVGLLELDFRRPGECELAFFGLVPDVVGSGLGRLLMNEAIRRAFRRPIGRFHVHTCSLDHPAALGFYIRSGFAPYKRAIEVADDPRLTGRLPLDAGPHVPVIGTAPPTRRRAGGTTGKRKGRAASGAS